MDASIEDNIELRWHNLRFDIGRSIRYHQRRRAFFERLDQLGNLLSLVFGSAAIYGLLGSQDGAGKGIALVAAAAVTVFSSINLVFGSARRAWSHADFARQYIAMEKAMLSPPSEALVAELTAQRLSIEAEEPPILVVLDCVCHNDQMRAQGYDKEDLVHISRLQRLFAQLIDISPDKIHAKA